MNAQIQTKESIFKIIQDNQHRIRKFGVRKMGLFGSFVRHEQDTQSDVDILVEFEPDQKTFDNFIQLSFLLEDALHRHVELVTTEALSPHIGHHILKEVEYVNFSS